MRVLIPVLGVIAVLVAIGPAGSPPAVSDDAVDCSGCHAEVVQAFSVTTHGRLRSFETWGKAYGCEGCHGDGAAHAESGDPSEIRRFDDDTDLQASNAACTGCHRSESLHDWEGSTHAMTGVGCTDCHNPHAMGEKVKDDPVRCYACHTEIQAQMNYPSHHPVREGHMTCAGCHTPHGGSIGLLRNEESTAALCAECHTAQTGPFLFEHEPVAEGCDTCHNPHGAVANNLLRQTEPFLCLQCHEMHFHAGLEGEEDDEVYVRRYDPTYGAVDGETYPGGLVPNPFGGQGYKLAFTTKCTQCHTQVHGTDLPSQAVSGGGKGLSR